MGALGCEEWCARRDSNPRPLGPQPNALSTELRAHVLPADPDATARLPEVAEREGFEPSTQENPTCVLVRFKIKNG